MLNAVNGVLLFDKATGFTSNASLQRVKRLFNAKKAGHTGSLDPLASGLLPICFGEATKFSRFLLDADKAYRVIAKLGEVTDTGDADGEVIKQRQVDDFSLETLEQTIQQFIGKITQVPPMYSALKHQGQPLYKLARQGIEVERKQREITIHSIELIRYSAADQTLELQVSCSKGTYIRTLVEDIGEQLGCGAHVQFLRRTQAGPFSVEQAFDLSKLLEAREDSLTDCLLDIDCLLQHLPGLKLTPMAQTKLTYGQIERAPAGMSAGLVRLYTEHNQFFGVGIVAENGDLRSQRLVNLELVI